MTKNEWLAKLHELAFKDTRLDNIPFVCFEPLAEGIASIEAAQQSVHLTCATGHVWDDMLNEEGVTIQVCQTCGTRR